MIRETEMGDFQCVCSCGATGPVGQTVEDARDFAADNGWAVDEDSEPSMADDECPGCVDVLHYIIQ